MVSLNNSSDLIVNSLRIVQEDGNLEDIQNRISNSISGITGAPPATMNTLELIATALNNDPNFFTAIAGLIGAKTDKSVTDNSATAWSSGTLASSHHILKSGSESITMETSTGTAIARFLENGKTAIYSDLFLTGNLVFSSLDNANIMTLFATPADVATAVANKQASLLVTVLTIPATQELIIDGTIARALGRDDSLTFTVVDNIINLAVDTTKIATLASVTTTVAAAVSGKQDNLTTSVNNATVQLAILNGNTVRVLGRDDTITFNLIGDVIYLGVNTNNIPTSQSVTEDIAFLATSLGSQITGKQATLNTSMTDPPTQVLLLNGNTIRTLGRDNTLTFTLVGDNINLGVNTTTMATATLVTNSVNDLATTIGTTIYTKAEVNSLLSPLTSGVSNNAGAITQKQDTLSYTAPVGGSFLAAVDGSIKGLKGGSGVLITETTGGLDIGLSTSIVCNTITPTVGAFGLTVADAMTVTGLASCNGGLNLDGTDITTLMNPYWVAGMIDGSTVTKLSDKGRHTYTVTQPYAGAYNISWTPAHPDGANYITILTGNGKTGNAWNMLTNFQALPPAGNSSTTILVLTRDNNYAIINGSFCFLILA